MSVSPMPIEPEPTQLYYRCVCGHDVNVASDIGGACDECGRSVSASALGSSLTQTICLSTDIQPPQGTKRPATADASLVGEQLGHFRVVAPLGSGGMGSVYRAVDESLQRFVALKVLSDTTIKRDDSERLLQEARSQARVNHPHVVQVYYVSRDEERPFLAMEHVDGPSLLDRMAQSQLSFQEIVDITLQTVSALEHSAKFDIVHGDIKPANILLANNREVKLSDFGLARRMSSKAAPEDGRTVAGTPSYMAPEITRGEKASPQSDQYSLGVMLYQLTFNRLPFKEKTDTVREMIEAHRNHSVVFPKPWPANLPHYWRQVLQKLLAKEPQDRYPTYGALLSDLKGIRPLNLPAAGIIPRAQAWFIDLMVAVLVAGMISGVMQIRLVEGIIDSVPAIDILFMVLLGCVGPAFGWVQATTGTTLGKKIFQIGIVNRYGLRPRKSKLFWRSLFQFLPIWLVPLARWIDGSMFGIPLGVIYLLQLLCVLLKKDRKSLHDLLFGTRVALGASR